MNTRKDLCWGGEKLFEANLMIQVQNSSNIFLFDKQITFAHLRKFINVRNLAEVSTRTHVEKVHVIKRKSFLRNSFRVFSFLC